MVLGPTQQICPHKQNRYNGNVHITPSLSEEFN